MNVLLILNNLKKTMRSFTTVYDRFEGKGEKKVWHIWIVQ